MNERFARQIGSDPYLHDELMDSIDEELEM